ncbi:hypothetical protein F5144DRAFT_479561 [Chaetomium tenue]|uniref:Uncharacterized protein n=1 Tax=Chaetomium tenue TaxID=1854479 RepID=A0ACB7PMD5_9PEZI|nr:hypothetical protein F5144DRAFT_479561 [Chaetomium globosum]
MNHDYVWPADGPAQASDGLHGNMMPSGLMAQPPSNGQRGSWASSQASGHSSRLGGLYVHTQKRRPAHSCGLPSPAPTAPAASPPHWPNHDASSVAGSWAPTSPISPAVGEPVAVGFHNQLLYTPNTTTQVIFDAGFQDWVGNTGFPLSFDHTYSEGPTGTSVPNGLAPDFSAPWPGQTPDPSRTNGNFLAQAFNLAPPPNPTTAVERIPPGSAEAFKQTNTPQSHPYPPCKRPLSRSQQRQQAHKRTKHSPSHGGNFPPVTDKKPRTNPHSSTDPETPTSTKSATLRTAARRVKRPTPSLKPGESPAHQRARTNHNLVEQQYRHRLHARFEALLDALPEGILGDEEGHHEGPSAGADSGTCRSGGGGAVKGKNNRRVSKVDVLSKAQRVIEFLQGDTERLRREVEDLRREKETSFHAGMVRTGGRG